MAQEQRGGAGGQQQTRRSISFTWTAADLGFTPTAQARVTFRRASPSPTTNTGFIVTTNPAVLTGATVITATATEPVGGGLPGRYVFALVQGQIESQSAFITFPPAATGTVATASWTDTYFDNNKLTSTITFSHAVTGVTTADFVVVNDAGTVQTGANAWTFDSVSSTIAANTGTQIAATPPSGVTADGYRIRLYQDSVRGPSATSNNSPAAAVDTPNIAVGNTASALTYSTRINFTYPATISQIHANVTADDNGFYFAQGNTIYAYNWDGSADTSRNVTLSGVGATDTIWGFTKRGANWAILTRETTTNPIARIREFNSTGSNILNFTVANSITTVAGETFRAPKGLATDGVHYWVRVVRSATGNMRLVKYTIAGAATNEDIVLANSEPSRLSDMTQNNDILWIMQQSSRIAYPVRVSDNAQISGLQTTANSLNTAPWAVAARKGNLYIAQREAVRSNSYLYQYSGIPSEQAVVLTAAWSNVRYAGGSLRADLALSGGRVSGVEASDFQVVNDSGTVQSGWTIADPSATSASQTISATPPARTMGKFGFRLRANMVRGGSSATDNSPATDATSGTADVDNRPLVATASFATATFFGGKLQAVLSFNQNVTGIETSDFTVQERGGTAPNYTWTDRSWTFDSVTSSASTVVVRATAPAGTHGTYRLQLNATSVRGLRATTDNSPANAVTSNSVDIDIRPVVATVTWDTPTFTSGKLSAKITFSSSVNGIATTDFEVINDATPAAVQSTWTIDPVVSSGTTQTISATPPANTMGNFGIRIKRRSVRGARATMDNSPETATASGTTAVDNRPPVVVTALWTNQSYSLATDKLTATLTFSGAITGLTLADLYVINANGITQSNWTFDPVSSTATSQTISVRPPPDTKPPGNNFAIVLRANSVFGERAARENSPASIASTQFVTVNNEPTVLTAAWDQESFAGGRLQARLTFSGGTVNGIEAKDFDVVNEMNDVQMNWTIGTPNATATQQFIVATPPDTVRDGEKYAIVLQGQSVEGPRATSDNSPATALESSFITIDTAAPTGGGGFNFGLINVIVLNAMARRDLDRDRDRER